MLARVPSESESRRGVATKGMQWRTLVHFYWKDRQAAGRSSVIPVCGSLLPVFLVCPDTQSVPPLLLNLSLKNWPYFLSLLYMLAGYSGVSRKSLVSLRPWWFCVISITGFILDWSAFAYFLYARHVWHVPSEEDRRVWVCCLGLHGL